MCPTNMASGRMIRVLGVQEVRTCTYDMLIEHAGVCAHPLLRPPFPELPEVYSLIGCYLIKLLGYPLPSQAERAASGHRPKIHGN